MKNLIIPNLVFNFLKALNTFNSAVRPSVRLSVCLSVCHKICDKINRRGQITGWSALPAGLVGFSAGRRLQKLRSAPRALARLQLHIFFHV